MIKLVFAYFQSVFIPAHQHKCIIFIGLMSPEDCQRKSILSFSENYFLSTDSRFIVF